MTTDNPQVPWTDEQWARVNQIVQEEASRARVAATFLPLIGPLPGDADFVRREHIDYPPSQLPPPDGKIAIDDRTVVQLATLQIKVFVRGAQMADLEMRSVLTLFRRAANVLARLEDAVVFRGLDVDLLFPPDSDRYAPPIPVGPPPRRVWEITGGQEWNGLWTDGCPEERRVHIDRLPGAPDTQLIGGISKAIGNLEERGHFGPFAVVLDQQLFVTAQTPSEALVLPQDRIIPFLGGGPLLRSSTLDDHGSPIVERGVVVALGGAPVELVIATDVCVQFLQLTTDPVFVFRVCEKMALRIKEDGAIIQLERPFSV
jgi:uncharacterized linocin/CFP29 family protein